MSKHSKIFPTVIWRLGENVILRLIKCLTPSVSFDTFMGNYFTSFRLLTHLDLTTYEQHLCSTKIGYANALSLGTNSCKKKKKLGHFEQRTSNKKAV